MDIFLCDDPVLPMILGHTEYRGFELGNTDTDSRILGSTIYVTTRGHQNLKKKTSKYRHGLNQPFPNLEITTNHK